MRAAVYLEQAFRSDGREVYTRQPFLIFLARLAEEVEQLTLVGRLDPEPGQWPYRVPDRIDFVGLPHYPDAADPRAVGRASLASLRTFNSVLAEVDAVWLIGPHGLAIPFAVLAALRRHRVVLGVRQELETYIRHRRPDNRLARIAASGLDATFRILARRSAVVVVGPDLATRYRNARQLLQVEVSLVSERDLVAPAQALERPYDGELRVLSVGRLDPEKNPVALAEVLADLRLRDRRWRLVVCGDGPLRGALEARLAELGVAEAAELRGHVPFGPALWSAYRESHLMLHVSLTEGVPQVLLEAFATGLPTVATAVGGTERLAAGAAVLVPTADPAAAAEALRGLATDPDARERLVRAGHQRARERTIEAECRRVAAFLAPR